MSALMQERTYSLDEMAGAFLAIRNKISEVQRKADREIKVLGETEEPNRSRIRKGL
jgi:hypothetical protein